MSDDWEYTTERVTDESLICTKPSHKDLQAALDAANADAEALAEALQLAWEVAWANQVSPSRFEAARAALAAHDERVKGE